MLALVERFPDLGQDLAKYVLEREQTKEPDTSITDNADWLVRCRVSTASFVISFQLQQTPCPVAWLYPLKLKHHAERCVRYCEQKRQRQNLMKIEELATAANPTAFKAAFRSRRRSIPEVPVGGVSSLAAYGSSGD